MAIDFDKYLTTLDAIIAVKYELETLKTAITIMEHQGDDYDIHALLAGRIEDLGDKLNGGNNNEITET